MKTIYMLFLCLSFIIMANGQQNCNPPTNLRTTTYSTEGIKVNWDAPYRAGRNDAVPQNSRVAIFDQSQLVNYSGAGYNGADVSSLYGDQISYGHSANLAELSFITDDFVLQNHSYISEMQFYAFQINTGIETSTITGVYVSIWDHNPVTGGNPVWGDFVTNRLVSSSWSGIYVTSQTDFTNTSRPVMKVIATIDTSLAAGEYWVTVSFSGNSSLTGPWVPPIRNLSLVHTGNALRFADNTWSPWRDEQTLGQYGLPLIIKGFSEPDSLAGFNILRDNIQLNTSLIEEFYYIDTDSLLLPNTEYCYSVKAVYLDGCISSATSPVCILSPDDPCLITSLPYSENFDTYGTGSGVFPTCWTKYSSVASNSYLYPYNYASSPASLYMYSAGSNYVIVTTPEFHTSIPLNTLRITFDLKKTTSNGQLMVGIMNIPDSVDSFFPIDTVSPTATNVWKEFSVDFNNYSGNGKHIAFKSGMGQLANTAYLDNVLVYPVPTCERPSDLWTTNVTNSSIDIVWHPVGSGAMWSLEYKLSNVSNWTVVPYLTDTVYTIHNLNSNTDYNVDIRVKSICSAGIDESIWRIKTINFRTLCTSITVLPYMETFDTYEPGFSVMPYCWRKPASNGPDYPCVHATRYFSPPTGFYFVSTSTTKIMASLPQIDPSIPMNTIQVRFMASMGASNYNIQVGIMTDPTDTSTFTLIQTIRPGIAVTWVECEVPFNNYHGTGRYITFKSSTGTANNFVIDNLIIEYISSCFPPTILGVSNITNSTTVVNWNSHGDEFHWNVELKLKTDSIWRSFLAYDTFYVFNNLEAGKMYDVRVRADCGTDMSRWSDVLTFITPCFAISILPYMESFDTYGTGPAIFPTCWSRYYSGTITTYPCIEATSYSAPGSLYMYAGSVFYTMASIPEVDISIPVNSLQATFKIRTTNPVYTLVVGVMNSPTDPLSFTPVATLAPTYLETWEPVDVKFDNYTGNGRYIAFKSGTGIGVNAVYIDDFSLYTIPSCERPTNVTANYITPTTAGITWNAGGLENEWVLEYKSVYESTWSVCSTILTNSYTLRDLTPNTTYDIRVKAFCGTNEESEYSFDYSFNTDCGLVTSLPYRENFDTYGFPGESYFPTCWSRIHNQSTNVPYIHSTNFYSSPASLYFYANTTSYSCAVSPQFDAMFDLSRMQVTFFLRRITGSTGIWASVFEIGIMTDPTDLSTFTVIRSIMGSEILISPPWTFFEVPLDSYTGNGKYIALRAPSGYMLPCELIMDNVTVELIPNCFRPIDISVSHITQTEADVVWSPLSGEMEWSLSYKTSSGSNWTIINNIYDTTYTITGLTPGTGYDVRVRAVCNANNSSEWTNTVSFITRCVPITILPYTENFDTYGTGTAIYPTCWIKNSTYSDYPYIYSLISCSPPGSLCFSTLYATYNIAVMPEINAHFPINNLQVSFRMRKNNAGYKLHVGVMTDPENATTFQLIQTVSSSTAGIWENFTVYLRAYTGQGKFIAFKTDANTTIYLDDVSVEYITDCIQPVAVHTSAITSATATVAWISGQFETEWEIAYGPTGFDVDTATVYHINNNPYYIGALTPATIYDVYVRTLCSGTTGDTTRWSDVLTFTTNCVPITSIPYNEYFDTYGTGFGTFPGCWIANTNTTGLYINTTQNFSPSGALYFSTANSTYSIAATPEILDALNLLQVTFKAKITNLNSKLELGVMNNPYDAGTFELIQQINPTTIYWNEYTIPLSSYSGNARHIAFKAAPGMASYIYLDNMEINWAPPCVQPVNVTVSDITSTSADISWVSSGDESEWIVIYGPEGFSPIVSGTVVNTHSFSVTLTGLLPQTCYDVYVKAACTPELQSVCSIASTFMTACGEITSLPYSESFDSYGTAARTYPDCWTRIMYPVTSNTPYISTTNYSHPGSLYFYTYPGSYTYAVLPKISDSINIAPLMMKFMMRKNSVASNIEVGVMTDPADPATFVPVTYFPLLAQTPLSVWNEAEVVFDSYSDTGKYIAFKSDISAINEIYIDNVLLDSAPACLYPVNLNVKNITSSSAMITWHNRSDVALWNVEYGIAGFLPGTGLTATVTDTSFFITGLLPQTNYELFVQSDCGNPTGIRSKISFKTACLPVTTLPVTESFDSYGTTAYTSFPTCWTRKTNYNLNVPYITTIYYSAPGSLYLFSPANGYTCAATNELLIPGMSVSSLKATFKLRKIAVNYNIQVGVMTDPTDYTTFTNIAALSPAITDVWEAFSVDFSSYTGTGRYIAFVSATSSNNSMYLDDLVIDSILTCFTPVNATATSVAINSAVINWLPGGVETEWILEYKKSSSPIWIPVNCTATSQTLNNLTDNTLYHLRIKAICSTTEESDYTPVLFFTTLPEPTTYIISANAGDNGTIEPFGDVVVVEGASQLFTITPNSGYIIEDILVDNVSHGAVNSYIFIDVRADHTIMASFASGIEENSLQNGIVIFPNPTNDRLHVRLKAKFESVEVTNLLGQVIFAGKVLEENFSIDLSSCNSGIYFIRLQNENGNITKKFIKE